MRTPELILPAKINLRSLAAVSKFAGSDENRYYLSGVRVEIGPRGIVYIATDGGMLLALSEERLRDEPDNDMTGNFTIPTAHCRNFKLKKDDDPFGEIYGDDDRLTLKRGDVEITFSPIEGGEFVGRWVDWRNIIPRVPLAHGVGQFDTTRLAAFGKFADEMPGGFHPFVAHNGPDGGALIRFRHLDAIGVVMPVKIDDQQTQPLPDWAAMPFRQAAE